MINRIRYKLLITGILALLFLSFALYSLLNEKYYKSPCKSSGEPLTDSLRKKYNIWSWNDYPKNFCTKCDDYDSSKVNCNVFTCNLHIKEPQLDFQQDSMIFNILNTFWSFPQNKKVDSLYLTIENNQKLIVTKNSKLDLKRKINLITYDTLKSISEFKIIDRVDGEEFGGGGDYEKYRIKTREILIITSTDLKDYNKVANYFFNKELQNCKVEKIATLTIKIITKKPKGQFIHEKTTNFYFEIISSNKYIKKKNL